MKPIKLVFRCGQVICPKAYFCESIDGIILSPNAIIGQYKDEYVGWLQYANCSNKKGEIRLISNNGQKDMSFKTVCKNGLWYHDVNDIYTTAQTGDARIHKLSNAARYELWHQQHAHVA